LKDESAEDLDALGELIPSIVNSENDRLVSVAAQLDEMFQKNNETPRYDYEWLYFHLEAGERQFLNEINSLLKIPFTCSIVD